MKKEFLEVLNKWYSRMEFNHIEVVELMKKFNSAEELDYRFSACAMMICDNEQKAIDYLNEEDCYGIVEKFNESDKCILYFY